jgi:hypothetical protein
LRKIALRAATLIYSSPKTIREMKSKTVRRARYAASIGKNKNAYGFTDGET